MSTYHKHEPETRLGRAVNTFEETAIAIMLGLMTILTFINVVLRYLFNSSIIWGLEVVLMLFAWLVLFGISYCVKVTAHLGVDAFLNILPRGGRRFLAIIAALCCVVYAVLLMKGAWDYWAPFAALQETTGRWFPTGFNESTRDRAFFETDQVPMLGILRWLEDAINQGDAYEKMPRMVPYTMLPVACALLLFRIVQATVDVLKGRRETLIASHEAEEAIETLAASRPEGGR